MSKSYSEITIRKMTKKDIIRISLLIGNTLHYLDGRKAKIDLTCQKNALYDKGENYIPLLDKKINGTIGYRRLKTHPKYVVWLDWFVVNSNYQKKGVGTVLFNFLMHKLKNKKFKILCCEKSDKNKSSNTFYKKVGFTTYGMMKKYWEDGSNLVLLFRKI